MLIDRHNKIVLSNKDIWVSSSDKTYPFQDIKRFRIGYLRAYRVKAPILLADFHDVSKYERKKTKVGAAIDYLYFKGGTQIENLNYFEDTPDEIVTQLNNQLSSFQHAQRSDQTT